MDYGRSSESNAITITPDPNSQEIWMAGLNDQALWATEEDYRNWNGADPTPPDSTQTAAYDSRSGSDQPHNNKRPRGGETNNNNNNNNKSSRAIGKMFFKTKLCCKFRAGTCPYITNCNFAHGIEELRKPPPNWQEIVAAQDADGGAPAEPREEHQIPILSSSTMPGGDGQRFYKGRHCKKFYTEEGCPYGDMCTFLHDEQSKARESVAISLGPTPGSGGGGGGAAANQKPSNWKTRICNKWEMTGYCPFGSKCHFAHGSAELHRYGGGLVDMDGRDSSSAGLDQKQTGTAALKVPADSMIAAGASVPHTDIYHLPPSQRSAGVNQRQSQRPLQRWKGPDKISRIYGDWIYDNE